jgi:phage shock protein PspC (stress-responsive transcriptional regulator)
MDRLSLVTDNAAMENHIETPPPDSGTDRPEGGSGVGRPPLRRVHGVLGGVAAGIADHFDVEPWLIRLAFFLLVFAGGLGVLAYVAGWLLIPEAGADESIGERWIGGVASWPAWVGVGLIVIAVLVLVSSLGANSGFIWALVLLVLGVLLYRGDLSPRDAEKPRGEQSSVTDKTPSHALPAAPRRARRERPEQVPRAPRPSSNLGRFTLAGLLIGMGAIALLDNAGVIQPQPQHYLAAALAIVGAGLVIGAVWGRSRGLIALGLILAFAMGVATIGDAATSVRHSRNVVYAPISVAGIADHYELGAGTMTIDLTNVPPADFSFSAHLGAGELDVLLPAGVDATVDSRVGVGQFDILGQTSEGLGIGRTVHVNGTNGTATINLDVGAGKIVVTQEATP